MNLTRITETPSILTNVLVDPKKSSSYKVVGENAFKISYVDGSGSQGDYFTDVFKVGGARVTNLTMGLGVKTDIPYGLLGLGYAINEAAVSTTGSLNAAYPNLPVTMVDDGLINTVAYSLWLNDLGMYTTCYGQY